MDAEQARARIAVIRSADGMSPADDLDELWAALPPVRPEDILGPWKGYAVATGHRVEGMLVEAQWHGKRFTSLSDVDPLICRDADGQLYSNFALGQGKATLQTGEFRGEKTAAMVYEGLPVRDFFKRIDEDALLGVMDGPETLDEGRHFYFVLERDR
ncbi:DUF4334 domain-containing protein [Streptomyces sp. NPDC056411]|uniref:DUF4334 domain-containing protein n=1 Tax=Streptomyces sp. NPDC056411 TaxID=3345813 RepID=UPI0035D6F65E